MAKISFAGQSCFQISVSPACRQAGIPKDHSADIVIDPFDDKTGPKVPNFSADILLITHDHHDHNNVGGVKGEPLIISGPGEYEVKGVFVQGIPAFHDDVQGKEKGKNTIYVIEAEDMRFCHLGDLGQKQLTDEQLEKIDTVDVLMIPVGGEGYTIDSAAAQKIIGQIDPKIVIPMHYQDVSKFLKAMGKNAIAPVDKLTVKQSTLPKEGATEIVILQP